ncbi:T9SS type A sorting domain-containing protein [Schleiferia thermophila]|jgi:hypothetical protein|uniref:T9SS type A sorting domain-containing protein n=1 Tax=Schleiferia thermophila TaxID=884107 RepID=UPI0004E712D4|nr:T9SS type A sorting domain-containing protein [Schleiferia thermophila]KFD38180.1 hypothetical protein AT05_11430 [Schleiferia thermophila str. Yellowstone]
MKKTTLFVLFLLSTISIAGPVKDLAAKRKLQLEKILNNPAQQIKALMKLPVGAATPAYHQKPTSVMIPDSLVNYFWDGSQYVFMGYDLLQYSAQLKVDYVKKYEFGALSQIIDFQYPGSTKPVSVLLNNNPVLSTQPDEKIEFTYDAQGRLIVVRYFEWVSNSWNLFSYDSIFFVTGNDPTKPTEIRFFNSSDGSLAKNVLSVKNITYDSLSGLEKNFVIAIDPLMIGNPIDFMKFEDCTWELGYFKIEDLFMGLDAILLEIYPRYNLFSDFNYSVEYGPTSYVQYEINLATNQFEPSARYLTNYSGGNLTHLTIQEYDGSGWYTVGKITPSLTNNKITQLDVEELSGNNYVLINREIFSYDSEGNFSGRLFIDYMSTMPDTSGYRYLRNYTGGKIMDEIFEIKSISGFDPIEKTDFFYKSNVSIREQFTSEISIYPNPSNDRIAITTPESEAFLVSFIDLFGRIVKQLSLVDGNAAEISVRDLPAGNYIIKIEGKNFREIKRFVKL